MFPGCDAVHFPYSPARRLLEQTEDRHTQYNLDGMYEVRIMDIAIACSSGAGGGGLCGAAGESGAAGVVPVAEQSAGPFTATLVSTPGGYPGSGP